MIEQDTIKLLRECDAGVKMGVSSIEDVLPHVQSAKLEKCLTKCKEAHNLLGDEIREKRLRKSQTDHDIVSTYYFSKKQKRRRPYADNRYGR